MSDPTQLSYEATIIKGSLFVPERARMQAEIKSMPEGQEVLLIVKPRGKEKTNPQLRAFHGPVLEQIQAWEQETNGVYKDRDHIKHELKHQFLPRVKQYFDDGAPKLVKVPHPEKKNVFVNWHVEETPSLAKLTKSEMRDFFDAFREYYLHECGLDIQIGDDLWPTEER
jgi:hypothetical protein